jgi:hypothetical protein
VSFERKAPRVWFAAAILAAATAGCALEGAEPTAEATASTGAELQGVSALHAAPVAAARQVSVTAHAGFEPALPNAVKPITLNPLESPVLPGLGGDTSDDPRPHPWEPQPNDNTQQGGSQGADPAQGSTGSSK